MKEVSRAFAGQITSFAKQPPRHHAAGGSILGAAYPCNTCHRPFVSCQSTTTLREKSRCLQFPLCFFRVAIVVRF